MRGKAPRRPRGSLRDSPSFLLGSVAVHLTNHRGLVIWVVKDATLRAMPIFEQTPRIRPRGRLDTTGGGHRLGISQLQQKNQIRLSYCLSRHCVASDKPLLGLHIFGDGMGLAR